MCITLFLPQISLWQVLTNKKEQVNYMNNEFKPYVDSKKNIPEMTKTSVILGIIIAVVFGCANAYLGLRVGMTVSASIPAAVISMGIIRVWLKKDSILENNMVQTIGSAGESLAAGAIFTLPALFMWGGDAMPSFLEMSLITLCGGVLGVMFMVPLRRALIVEEHGKLPFPEGTACAEVLLAGEKGGKKSGLVFSGLGISAGYKFLTDGVKLFPSEVDYSSNFYRGAGFGVDVLPALLGVGYICGIRIASYMFAGGILAWLVLMPAIALFGADSVIAPATELIRDMSTWDIWGKYVRYIGAGAVAAGGIISLFKSLPVIWKTFKLAILGYGRHKSGEKDNSLRTELDMPMWIVAVGILGVALLLFVIPSVPISFAGILLILVFGFFFATVSSRMVGLVGSSNNPVSGMAIATLIIATAFLKLLGYDGYAGMTSAICIGTVICIVAAMAGDTSQDLKTGYIVGATPVKQQIGELIGTLAAGLAIGGVLYLLNSAWGYGSTELPAPQATLMKLVVEGVMGGSLPWTMVLCGIGIAIAIEVLGLPVLPVAIGLYLPIHLSAPIFIGALVRWYISGHGKEKSDNGENMENSEAIENGTLFSSGLIAGEGLVGILLAVFALISYKGRTIADIIDMGNVLGYAGSIIFFAALIFIMVRSSLKKET